ncbi:PsbP-related protein [Lacibacter sp. H375]|uniref:PsbP-related protein n=1 Tax=Lacibacter sp. H375 TaxID=3133424 RepID=UPI0030BB0B78
MKKLVVALILVVSSAAAWAQPARIPVNDLNTGTNNKPNNNTTNSPNTPTTTSSELKKYSDPKGRFTIGYPGDWNFDDKLGTAVFKITSPAENGEDKFFQYLNLQIEELNSGTTVDDYVKTNMDAVKDFVKGYREVSSMFFNRNGSRAYQIIYKGKPGEMTYDVQIKQLFCINNGKGYVLTYISKEGERDAYETTANKIFNSFKF